MHHPALRVIRDEHASLAAMLQSMLQMIKRGPDADGTGAGRPRGRSTLPSSGRSRPRTARQCRHGRTRSSSVRWK